MSASSAARPRVRPFLALLAALSLLTAFLVAGGQTAATAEHTEPPEQEIEPLEPPVDVVYIARGFAFPDSLVGSVLAALTNAPILLVRGEDVQSPEIVVPNSDVIPQAVIDELRRLEPDEIVIFGGPNAVSNNVEQQLRTLQQEWRAEPNVRRIAGATRFETAVQIAQEIPSMIARAAWADRAGHADHADTAGDAETLQGFAPEELMTAETTFSATLVDEETVTLLEVGTFTFTATCTIDELGSDMVTVSVTSTASEWWLAEDATAKDDTDDELLFSRTALTTVASYGGDTDIGNEGISVLDDTGVSVALNGQEIGLGLNLFGNEGECLVSGAASVAMAAPSNGNGNG